MTQPNTSPSPITIWTGEPVTTIQPITTVTVSMTCATCGRYWRSCPGHPGGSELETTAGAPVSDRWTGGDR